MEFVAIKACGECGERIDMRGPQMYCPPCSKKRRREKRLIENRLARRANPELFRARAKAFRAAQTPEQRARARLVAGDRRAYMKNWHNQVKYGGLKPDVLSRDGNSCRLCVAVDSNDVRHLTIHHIDGIKDNNVLDNLITLCRQCHARIHYRGTPTRQDELRELITRPS
jgi:5-methylcytosine-specific restriction endonuclease McrA